MEYNKFSRIYLDEEKTDYYINRIGDIYSLKTKKYLSPAIDKDGYKIVCLTTKKSGRKNYKVHRLVALTFLIYRESHRNIVNHKNGIKTDNRVENLEWCTVQENSIHSVRNGMTTYEHKRGEKSNFNKHSEDTVRTICELFEQGYSVKYVCECLDLKKGFVYKIYRKERWKHVVCDYKY
ncbi:HNH endonuclease [Romboutsia ilealis]|uniref:HNH endonuclease n=1 Tax=Romboutsia ilealis TaxID=1115758 RepID=UPI00272C5DFB|nr:HNH endonuclease [Romboutsia ilealis]